MTSIGIIGNGFVGNAIAQGFSKMVDVKIYDLDSSRATHTLKETINTDFVFICLPTPMVDAEGGECNLSVIEGFFNGLKREDFDKNKLPVFIIKSTVPIGTTKKLQEKYSWISFVHNPEFLTAINAAKDFLSADRTVIGGNSPDSLEKVRMLYKYCFPSIPIHTMSSDESESVKYFANCFLATKVMFFNEVKLLSEKLNIDYDKISKAVVADSRISNSHCNVPGLDGDYGFGGTCFPKDINALIATMENNGIDPIVLKSVWEQNKNVRKNWDWADNTSAVLSE